VLTVIQGMLENLGHNVLPADTVEKALLLFEEHRDEIALVITDLTMPRMDGEELAEALRARGATVPVVLVTGYPLQTDSMEAEDSLVVASLSKPVKEEALAQVLAKVIGGEARGGD